MENYITAPIKYVIKASILRPYFALRKHPSVWRLYSHGARRRFKRNPPKLNQAQKHIVESLHADGIAVTHIKDIHPQGEKLLQELILLGAKQLKSPKK